jgi:putative transposase
LPLFHDDSDRWLYIEYLRSGAAELGITFLAWCLMTNHVHLVAVPETVDAFTRLFFRAHKDYAEHYNRKYGNMGKLFQARRHQSVLDEHYFVAVARYVNRNPVRAGMVSDVTEHDWSSARFLLGESAGDPLISTREPFDMDLDWATLLEHDPVEVKAIRRCTRSGCPMGSGAFVRRVLERHGFSGLRLEALLKLSRKLLGLDPPRLAAAMAVA